MTDGIDAFWAWWPTGSAKLLHAIETGDYTDALVAEVRARVEAIEPGFEWELGAGDRAQHAFCLSSVGDAEKRVVTEVWKLRGPGDDATWEFHPARKRGDLDGNLDIGGHEIAFASVVVAFALDDDRERADLVMFHPAFPELDDDLAERITYLALDTALGEDDVERWVGTIEVVREAPAGAVPLAALVVAIDALAATATGEQFALLQGEDADGSPLVATLNLALKRIDHLLAIVHVAIDLAIVETDPADLRAIQASEAELADALGKAVVYFGRETRRGRRVLHYFAPEDSPARAIVERWVARVPTRTPVVTFTRDPAWQVRRRFV